MGLKNVPRNQTFLAIQGGANGTNPDFANFNVRTVGGSVNGWHSGALQTMAEPLIMFDVLTGEYENWLAESWQYNPDFTEITLKLRKGIEWSDGTPFTSNDVAFTFNVVRDNQDKMVHTAEISFLKEASAVDDLTIRFTLNKPNPRWWATTLTSNHGIVEQFYPEAVFKGQDPLTFHQTSTPPAWSGGRPSRAVKYSTMRPWPGDGPATTVFTPNADSSCSACDRSAADVVTGDPSSRASRVVCRWEGGGARLGPGGTNASPSGIRNR